MPTLLVVFLFFLVTVFPVSGIAQAGPQIVADRFTYLPSLGWSILFGGALVQLGRRVNLKISNTEFLKLLIVFALLVLFSLSILTISQIGKWKDSETLLRYEILLYPKSSLAYDSLGNVFVSNGMINEAAENYKLAIMFNPAFENYYLQMADEMANNGYFASAILYYSAILGANPMNETAILNAGHVFFYNGKPDEAIRLYETALISNPQFFRTKARLDQIKVEKNLIKN